MWFNVCLFESIGLGATGVLFRQNHSYDFMLNLRLAGFCLSLSICWYDIFVLIHVVSSLYLMIFDICLKIHFVFSHSYGFDICVLIHLILFSIVDGNWSLFYDIHFIFFDTVFFLYLMIDDLISWNCIISFRMGSCKDWWSDVHAWCLQCKVMDAAGFSPNQRLGTLSESVKMPHKRDQTRSCPLVMSK